MIYYTGSKAGDPYDPPAVMADSISVGIGVENFTEPSSHRQWDASPGRPITIHAAAARGVYSIVEELLTMELIPMKETPMAQLH